MRHRAPGADPKAPFCAPEPARTRVPRALRRGLQRRIFVSFGVTIFMTSLVVFTVMQLAGVSGTWRHDVDRARRFASRQLAAVWNDPPRRRVLVGGIAADLELGLSLYDVNGALLESAGGVCTRRAIQVKVFDPGTGVRLGRADVCPTGAMLPTTQRALLGFGVALVTLWAASGILARRLSRPLADVAEVAREIGRGHLESKERLAGRRHRDETGIVADALYEAATRIDKQLADQRALLAAVSHEIRTPLARMRLLVELAETAPQKLPEIDREIVELDALVADLLAGARIDFSALKPVPIDTTVLVRGVLEREGVDLSRLSAPDAISVIGDATLLGRAVTNLVQNAIKHGGGIDRVEIARAGEHVSIAFLDRGPGIAPGDEARLFEPFYRRPDAKGGGYGASVGLGLTLVRRIAEAHGGHAFAEAREGGGARMGFVVRA
ncbi:MAG: HAMP domain-containing histidine kinase [Myxococcales bacterium]|nr:HAMP domain-containing histidine kinase [Myxococcales bacterium]